MAADEQQECLEECPAPPAVHLDDAVVQTIARCLVKGEAPGNTLLQLLAMCGVCKQWRSLASELGPDTPLAFDGMDNTLSQGQSTVARFRKLAAKQKEQLFVAAAGLFKGYTVVTLAGDSITDAALQRMAAANGSKLRTVKLVGTGSVTDAGVLTLVSSAPALTELHLEDVGKGVTGSFLPTTLDVCRQLEALHIEGASGMDWRAMQWWSIARASSGASRSSSSNGSAPAVLAAVLGNVASGDAAAAGPLNGGAAITDAIASGSAQAQLAAIAGTSSSQGAASAAGGLAVSSVGAVGMEAVGAAPSDLSDSNPPGSGEGGSLSSDEADGDPRSPMVAASSSSSSGGVMHGSSGAGSSRMARHAALLRRSNSGSSNSSIANGGSAGGSGELAATAALVSQQEQLLGQLHLHGQQPQAQQQQQQHRQQQNQQQGQQQQQVRCAHAPRLPASKLTRLRVRCSNVECLQPLLQRLPALTELELDGRARNIQVAAVNCQRMRRVSYLVSNQRELETALWSFTGLSNLQALELVVRNMALATDHMKVLGMLPVSELRIDSYVFKQQPTLARPQYSHVDNDGVKGLVDSICTRLMGAHGMRGLGSGHGGALNPSGSGVSGSGGVPDVQPLKLSLCGATALSHEAVSALLRLPILTELDIGGCCRISAMDKMRLVAKVKAGRELLEGRGQGAQGAGYPHALRFPGLL